MKFLSNSIIDSPVSLEIDDATYQVPRMTGEDWEAREADQIREKANLATEGLSPEQRMRAMMYFDPEPTDANVHLKWAVSPPGIAWVLKRQMDAAGVTEEHQAIIFRHPMYRKRQLANMLCDSDEMVKAITDDTNASGSGPLVPPTPESNA